MKKTVLFIIISMFLALTFCFNALAYSSPFSVPSKATPGSVNGSATVKYSLREGGTFMYCNNPELLLRSNLDKALMIERDISGDVYFTSENRNFTYENALMGLQVRNDSGKDITVTVHNIGYQVGVDWVGQQEWTDFFDTAFEIEPPIAYDSFTEVLQPAGFKETSYTIPSGKYFYVMGGSTYDAYKNINVGGSANKPCPHGDLVNSAVYFTVDGPETGVSVAFVCYRSGLKPVTTDDQQGYVVSRDGEDYSRQYLGSAPYLCAEASIAWDIDDTFADNRKLPVRYSTQYYTNTASYGAYGAYKNPQTRNITGSAWYTHLNPNNNTQYIGTDMMPFYCVTEDGKEVVIDIQHNDGSGKTANIGNWMVIYEESLTFKNSGEKIRTFTLDMKNNGIKAVNIRDEKGDLIKSVYHSDSSLPVYTVTVPAGKAKTIVVEYVLLANGYGSVEHSVTVGSTRYLRGDIDGNGEVDAIDYVMAKRSVLGTYKLDDEQFVRGDIDGDGNITAVDYVMIKRHVLNTYVIE